MDGILIINKPKNCTSHDIVYKIRKITNEKVGHTGTLDPMAQGVLPILIGKATKCSAHLTNHDKKYIVTLKLGKKTTTADEEGEIVEEVNVNKEILNRENVENVLNYFIGEQEQIPPMYSAIKINGKKLYEYARKGQKVEIKPRKIQIYLIQLLEIDWKSCEIKFEVKCSKGTYIRSLCEDIAKILGTVGYMKELLRIEVGEFNINQSIPVENLTKNKIEEKIIKIEEIFKSVKKYELDKRKLQLFLNGVKLNVDLEDGVYRIYKENIFIGTGVVKDNFLKRDIII